MQKIKLSNKTELEVVSIIDCGNDMLQIEFGNVELNKVLSLYSPNEPTFSQEVLASFELIDIAENVGEGHEPIETIMGVHLGYTQPEDISVFNGKITVKISKEPLISTTVRKLQQSIAEQEQINADLMLMIATMGGTK